MAAGVTVVAAGHVRRFAGEPRRRNYYTQGRLAALRRAPRLGADALHVIVREAEVVADLVQQHLAHQAGQAAAVLRPLLQQRLAVEEHQVRCLRPVGDRLLGQAHALVQAQQVVGAVELQLPAHVRVRQVLDPDRHRLGVPRQPPRDLGPGALGQVGDVLQGRRAAGHAGAPVRAAGGGRRAAILPAESRMNWR